MKYEETPINKTVSKEAVKKHKNDQLDKVSTSAIIWHLVKRHKFALVTTYAVVLSVFYFMPFLPDILFSIVR